MNILSWAIIGIIAFFIIAKNWDRIESLFNRRVVVRRTEKQSEFVSELTIKDIEQAKKNRKQYLMNEKEKRKNKIDLMTRELREEIKKINIQLAMLEEQPKKKKVF